jgi:hypothetical protein
MDAIIYFMTLKAVSISSLLFKLQLEENACANMTKWREACNSKFQH